MSEKVRSSRGKPRADCGTLEASHISRKRELDRAAQRASRERTKNRLRFLEEQLALFKAEDKPSQISDLMKEISDLREENARLRATLLKIRAWANVDVDVNSCTENSKDDTKPQSQLPQSSPPSSIAEDTIWNAATKITDHDGLNIGGYPDEESQELLNTNLSDEHPIEATFNPEGDNQDLVDLDAVFSPNWAGMMAPASSCYVPNPFLNLLHSDPSLDFWPRISDNIHIFPRCPGLPDEAKWSFGNQAYTYAIESSRRIGIDGGLVELHTPFRAILSGWDVVDEGQRSHPMWAALRQVDEQIFANWSNAQKIAIMVVTQRLLLYRVYPTKENLNRVPPFLRPRPSQERIEHPLVIDFLLWPALRDRLVFNHERYSCTGDFSAAYCSYIRFHWPFPDHYILSRDVSNTYRISKLFEKYAFDVKNWTVDERFFTNLPELRFDVPCSADPRPECPLPF